MSMLETSPPARSAPDGRRRASIRRRGLLAALVAGALAWSMISFLTQTGSTSPTVTIVPGTEGGSIGTVQTITSTVTAPKGNAQLQEGVAFARLDIANAYHQKVAVSLAWVNPTNFSVQTQTANWQIRLGLYYPVRTGACDAYPADPVHAVTLAINGSDHCLYRDLTAEGAGVSLEEQGQAYNHVGTQMLAFSRLNATLLPKANLSGAVACTVTTDTDGCLPAGTDTNVRATFVVGSLLNPGGTTPPGKEATIEGLRLSVVVSQS